MIIYMCVGVSLQLAVPVKNGQNWDFSSHECPMLWWAISRETTTTPTTFYYDYHWSLSITCYTSYINCMFISTVTCCYYSSTLPRHMPIFSTEVAMVRAETRSMFVKQ